MSEKNLSENGLSKKSDQSGFLIVGIGASAGGIQALKEFFDHVPSDSGIAYVVILHLSPDHDSQLAEVLQLSSQIPVTQVTEKVLVEPNRVYVVPPNRHLEMQDDSIVVSPNTMIEDRRAPVDIFFRTLAEAVGPRAVAVVLSGTGANGSMGLKRVKEKGGSAFVQDPREAEFNEMPRNSIATELVDEVLPVAEIPAKIFAFKKNLGIVEIPVEAETRPEDQQQALSEIFAQLRFHTSHDFSNYKRPTLLRRIERRINVRNLPSLTAYVAFLHQHPEETQALLKDLLISVTNFFRDEKPFEAIEQDILPRILQGKKTGEQVRIWVAGCATGEEAYSIAMLCAERTFGALDAPKIQIFATDIDETAIIRARDGFYSLNDAADVSAERLHRFFAKEDERYRIRREIREMILFANHNLIKDPPFSHLDLVACRNLLIYLNPIAQERVMETLHFALKPGGYLFLGTSESADGASDLFAPFSREQHIYQTRQIATRSYPVPESVPVFRLQQTLHKSVLSETQDDRTQQRISYGDLHQKLLEKYAPPSVLINEEYDLVHLSDRAGRYMQIAGGEVSKNLLSLVRQELRLELRVALYQAVKQRTNVEAKNLKVKIDERTELVNIHVRPVFQEDDTARGFILVLFEQGGNSESDTEKDNPITLATEEPMARHLEEELIRVKSQLRLSNEQHEVQAEELKASNEELQAINEELRSAAEELETSKEELQSVNEELRTVNQELKVKIEEVSLTGNNLQNLFNSTDIATIFLNRNFRVQLFSPAACELFNLIPTDFGRPLTDLTHRLVYTDLHKDVETVLDKLNTIEREVETTDGRSYLMRVLPYRTAEDRIDGVVATFIDITRRKRAETQLADELKKMRDLYESSTRLLVASNLRAALEQILESSLQLLQADFGNIQLYDAERGRLEIFAQRGFQKEYLEVYQSVTASDETAFGRAIRSGERCIVEDIERDAGYKPHRKIAAATGYRAVQSTPLLDRDGKLLGVLSTHFRDPQRPSDAKLHTLDLYARLAVEFIVRTRNERALRESEARLQTLTDLVPDMLWSHSTSGFTNWHNQRWSEYTGQSIEQAKGYAWFDAIHPEEREKFSVEFQKAVDSGEPLLQERRIKNSAGNYRWFLIQYHPIKDDAGKPLRGFCAATDIHEQRLSLLALTESEERQRVALQAAQMGTWDWNLETGEVIWSAAHNRMYDLPMDQQIGSYEQFFNQLHPDDRQPVADKLQQAIDERRDFAAEMRSIHSDGSIHWIAGNGHVFYDQQGNPSRMIGVVRDITATKQALEELQQAHTELEKRVEERTFDLHNANLELQYEITKRTEFEEERQRLLRRIVVLQEEERRRISRELHDNLGQQLTALRLGIDAIIRSDGKRSGKEAEELQEIIKRMDAELDFMARELRPSALDELGLPTTISNFLEEWSKLINIPAEFHTSGITDDRFSPEIEINLYRIVQETLNNVSKHAQATHVAVILERRDEQVILIIEDNGIGFALHQKPTLNIADKGLGLVGMRERAALIGGTVEIESSPGTGTTIFVRVPILSLD